MRQRRLGPQGAKAALFIALIGLLLGAAMLTYQAGENERQQTLSAYAARMGASVNLRIDAISTELASMRREVVFLANVPPVDGITRAIAHHGYDPQEGSSRRQWEQRLGQIFASFMKANQEVICIRLIGLADGGKEILRTRRPDQKTGTVPASALMQQGAEDFFRATHQLAAGQVYLSEFRREHSSGCADRPDQRVIHAATPVLDANGGVFGMVVLTADADAMLASLYSNLAPEFQLFLTAPDGSYLVAPRAAGPRTNWYRDYQNLPDPADSGLGLRRLAGPGGATARPQRAAVARPRHPRAKPDTDAGFARQRGRHSRGKRALVSAAYRGGYL